MVRDWLDERAAERPFDGLGIATFGPVDLDPTSSTYGFITHSPKPGWADVNVLGFLTANLPRDLPVGFDTDVNAPAMAEFAAMKRDAEAAAAEADDDDADDDTPLPDPTEGITNLAYVTVGTGVGVGVVCAATTNPCTACRIPRRATSASRGSTATDSRANPALSRASAPTTAIASRAWLAPPPSPRDAAARCPSLSLSSTLIPRGTPPRITSPDCAPRSSWWPPRRGSCWGAGCYSARRSSRKDSRAPQETTGRVRSSRFRDIQTRFGGVRCAVAMGKRRGHCWGADAGGTSERGGAEEAEENLEIEGGALHGGDLLGVHGGQGGQREDHKREVGVTEETHRGVMKI